MQRLRHGVRQFSMLAIAIAALLGSQPAAAQDRAADVFQRLQQLQVEPGIANGPRLLPPSEAQRRNSFLSPRPSILNWAEAKAAPAWAIDSIRYYLSPIPQPAIYVVQQDFVALPNPGCYQAYLYWKAESAMTARAQAPIGAFLRGKAAMYALEIPYATRQAWSLTPTDDTALCYVLDAVDPATPFDFAWLGDDDRSFDKQKLRAHVDARLSSLYADDSDLAALVEAQRDRLLDDKLPAPPQTDDDASQPADPPPDRFRLGELFRPKVIAGTEEPSGEFRQRLIRYRDEIVEHATKYPHLPSRLRAVRALQSGALNDAWIEAVAAMAPDPQPAPPPAGGAAPILAEVETLRQTAFRWFEEEVALRGNAQVALPTANTVGWDPYALSELTAFLIDTSTAWARLVRIPARDVERGIPGNAQLQAHCDQAWTADPLLTEVGRRFGKPDFRVVQFPYAEDDRALLLIWRLRVPGRQNPAEIKLLMTTALSSGGEGGGGMPVPPGLVADQTLPIRRNDFRADRVTDRLDTLGVGDYVESLTDLVSGPNPPADGRVWVETLGVNDFQIDRTIEIAVGTEAHRRLRGTASQMVWARRQGPDRPWGWMSLGKLRAGDFVWSTELGAVPLTSVRVRDKEAVACRRPTIGGFDPNTHVHGFVVLCDAPTIEARARHGVHIDTMITVFGASGDDTSARIGDCQADLRNPEFVKLPGFSSDSNELLRRKDRLINNADDQTTLVYWIVYEMPDGNTWQVGTNHSHGFLAVREKREVVAAHELRVGDLLVRGEDKADLPPARVVRIALETFQVGPGAPLKHPRLLRGEWFQSVDEQGRPGPLLHTDVRQIDLPGVESPSEIALTFTKPGAKEIWHSDPALVCPIADLAVFRPQPDGSTPEFHLTLNCWPGGSTSLSGVSQFMARPVELLTHDVVADLVELHVTESGRVLRCTPATSLWRQSSETTVSTTTAKEIREGDRILMLRPDAGPAATRLETVKLKKTLDAFEDPERQPQCYYDTNFLDLTESHLFEVARLQTKYDNIFAEGFLVNLGEPGEMIDSFPSGPGDDGEGPDGGGTGGRGDGRKGGDGPGRTNLKNAGDVVGRATKPIDLLRSPLRVPSIDGEAEVFSGLPTLQFSEFDRSVFQRSLGELDAAMEAFLAKRPPTRIAAGSPEGERFKQFCQGYRATTDDERIFSDEALRSALARYLEWRAMLISSGQPAALAGMATEGLPTAYLLSAAGGPGRRLLDDLITVHLRSALRPDFGAHAWRDGPTRSRAVLAFALEFYAFEDEGQPNADDGGFNRYRRVRIDDRDWRDLLDPLIGKTIHKDVRLAEGSPDVLLWNLLLQLDALAGERVPLHHGFITNHMRPGTEFAPDTHFARTFGVGASGPHPDR